MQELFRYPLIGAILYRLQMIRVDTCGGGKERENLAQFAKRAHDSGRHIAIYPEGNLMAPGERERYRSGIYYLYPRPQPAGDAGRDLARPAVEPPRLAQEGGPLPPSSSCRRSRPASTSRPSCAAWRRRSRRRATG